MTNFLYTHEGDFGVYFKESQQVYINFHIFLIHNELWACWQNSNEGGHIWSDRWHGDKPKRNRMHDNNEKCNATLCWLAENSTVRCRYNAVNFNPNLNKIHPITRPWGRDMECFCEYKFLCMFYLSLCRTICKIMLCYVGPRYNGTRLYVNCTSAREQSTEVLSWVDESNFLPATVWLHGPRFNIR